MIQLNLLPDVKLQFIKARRTKRLVILTSSLAIVVSIGLFGLMFSFVNGVQQRHIKNLDKDIDSSISKIQNTPEIDKILTVQNQLASINPKHQEKPAANRVLPMIADLIPAGSALTEVNVDFTSSIISISGATASVPDTNKFVDTLKFAQFKAQTINPDGSLGEVKEGKAFSEVVLGTFSTVSADGRYGFAISLKFDPVIFLNTEKVEITVPGIVSTRSSTEKPNLQFTEDNKSGQ